MPSPPSDLKLRLLLAAALLAGCKHAAPAKAPPAPTPDAAAPAPDATPADLAATPDSPPDLVLPDAAPADLAADVAVEAPASACVPGFVDQFPSVMVGSVAQGLVTADFDGDGRPDLATTHYGGGIYLARNLGGGLLAEPAIYPAVDTGMFLTSGDFDRDGRPDLAAVSYEKLFVLLNDGQGKLEPATVLTSVFSSRGLVAADLDGDAILDLAVAGDSDRAIGFFRGRGDGSFEAKRVLPFDGIPGGLLAADLDGDGIGDLLTSETQSNVLVVMRGQRGSGPDPGVLSQKVEPGWWRLGDLDGDGKLDLLIGDHLGLAFLRGNGNGTLAAPVRQAGLGGSGPTLADLDRDGRLDLVLADSEAGPQHVAVARGRGDGTFEAPRRVLGGPLGAHSAVADFTGDGKPDVAVLNENRYNLSVFAGRGDGTLAGPAPVVLPDPPAVMAGGDLDGDGKPDLITASGAGQLQVLIGAPPGLRAPVAHPAAPTPRALAVVKFTDDKLPDVVVVGGSKLSLFRGDGTGLLAPRIDSPLGFDAVRFSTGDLDGDGHQDLVATTTVELWVAYGDGAGGISSKVRLSATLDGNWPSFAVADFDRDGLADVAALVSSAPTPYAPPEFHALRIFAGNRDRAVKMTGTQTIPERVRAMLTTDLDRDGLADLVLAARAETAAGPRMQAIVVSGKGDGTFRDGRSFELPHDWQLGSLEVVDFDGDGVLDLFHQQGGGFAVMYGQVGGTLRPGPIWVFPNTGSFFGDFDGDRRVDLAIAHGPSKTVVIQRNVCRSY